MRLVLSLPRLPLFSPYILSACAATMAQLSGASTWASFPFPLAQNATLLLVFMLILMRPPLPLPVRPRRCATQTLLLLTACLHSSSNDTSKTCAGVPLTCTQRGHATDSNKRRARATLARSQAARLPAVSLSCLSFLAACPPSGLAFAPLASRPSIPPSCGCGKQHWALHSVT